MEADGGTVSSSGGLLPSEQPQWPEAGGEAPWPETGAGGGGGRAVEASLCSRDEWWD